MKQWGLHLVLELDEELTNLLTGFDYPVELRDNEGHILAINFVAMRKTSVDRVFLLDQFGVIN